MDKQGIVHSAIGKIGFDASKLAENAHALIGAILKAKPSAAKGKFVKKVVLGRPPWARGLRLTRRKWNRS